MPEPKKPEATKPRQKPRRSTRPGHQRALDNLAAVLGGDLVGTGRNAFRGGRFGGNDMYFLWSLERVGVVFGLDKIRQDDWYQFGADILIPTQNATAPGGGGHGREVDTAFALLFLAKSNLVRDLSAKVQRDPPTMNCAAARRRHDPVAVAPTRRRC